MRNFPIWGYKLLLVAATVIWGFSFVVMKGAVDVMPPATLLGVRFTATALILLAIFWKSFRAHLNKDYIWCGIVLGVLNFLAFWAQTVGITDTTPGKNAFLTGTYCVIVPFVWWVVARKRPTVYNVTAAILAVAGIGFVSLSGSIDELNIRFGDAMTLLGAVLFAVQIVYVAKYSETRDVLALTVTQFLSGGVCGLVVGFGFEAQPPLESVMNVDFFVAMAYLVVCASCIALVFQNISLVHVPPAQASLFLSLEAVFGVVFSVLLYGESLTLRLVFGFVLIFAAIILSEVFPLKPKEEKQLQKKES